MESHHRCNAPEDRLDLLRECDEILLEEIVSANLYRTTSQVFAVLLPIQAVGVMGDGRSYESVVGSVVALRSWVSPKTTESVSSNFVKLLNNSDWSISCRTIENGWSFGLTQIMLSRICHT